MANFSYMKKKLQLVPILFLFFIKAVAVPVTGIVKNDMGDVLSFSSIVIKGTTIGTTANDEGRYHINLPQGSYTIQCMHIGYAASEQTITVGNEPVHLDFVLHLQQITLKEIIIGKNTEDPAYEIIRQAIKKRPYYKNQVDAFQCQVYIKGQLRLNDYPNTIFGQKVDFNDGDTGKNKMIYLSETIADYYYQKPNHEKVIVTSTRVSGQGGGFGFSDPRFLTFYDNNIQVNPALNPRGFISPIADNALSFYRYRFLGSFIENEKTVNRIMVIPKRLYEPLFSGIINITEDDWRIHSVSLMLTKSSQMELADTLRVEQLYVPVTKDVWMIQSQVLYPSVKILGFDAKGNFVSVYNNYRINPVLDKKLFNNVVVKYDTGSNKKPREYWNEVRPVPLLADEALDYKRKDSMEIVRNDPHYLDSVDRKRNKLTIGGVLLFGQTFTRQSKKSTISYRPLIEAVNFNTVEGFNIDIGPTYSKKFSETKSIDISPTLRYGLTNKHFNADLSTTWHWGGKSNNAFILAGGKKVLQMNNESPVRPTVNTYYTLLNGPNYLKLYEAWFGKLEYIRGIGEALTIKAAISYQDRMPLENRDNTFWGRSENLAKRTPNYPTELTTQNFIRHQALTGIFSVSYQPGTKFIQLPDRKINLGSKYPLLGISYTKGFKNLLGSDIDYDRWKFTVRDEFNLKLWGMFNYNIALGGFLNNRQVEIPDYQHFNGNRFLIAATYMNSFQLAQYYELSTTSHFFSTLNIEHHFNGFLTNKIPFIKTLNIRLVAGGNAFLADKNNYYYEVFSGIENILKIFRVDYVRGYSNAGYKDWGIRIGIRGVTGN